MGKFSSLVGAIAISAGISLSAGAASAETKLRLGVETTSGDPLNVMLAGFRDALQESGGDEVTIDFFEGNSLGDEGALAELVRAGQVEVVSFGTDIVALDPKFAIFDAPFLFESKQAAREALDGELGQLLAKSLRETADLQVLGFGELGVRQISNNRGPIHSPADLNGLKMRVSGSEGRLVAFRKLGAAPTFMSLGDVYVALRQGAIDGQENPLSVIKENSFFEVQKYISLTNHIYSPVTLAMNGRAWDALPDDMKAKLVEAARAGTAATRKLSDDSDAKLVAEFESKGVQINEVDPAPFVAVSGEIHEAIGSLVGKEFMDQAVAALR